jgi:hypothetical protein
MSTERPRLVNRCRRWRIARPRTPRLVRRERSLEIRRKLQNLLSLDYKVKILITTRGADGSAPFWFSTDGGKHWSEKMDAAPGSVFDMGGGVTLTFDGGSDTPK